MQHMIPNTKERDYWNIPGGWWHFSWQVEYQDTHVGLVSNLSLQWRHYEHEGVWNHLLFADPFIQVQIKENIKAKHHWPL